MQDTWKIGELAGVAGLTVRTLHHYDEIGLLKPSSRTLAGHRIYGEDDVARLYRILALRELGLGLGEVASLLNEDGVDPRTTVRRHLERVEEQIQLHNVLRDRLVRILGSLEKASEPTAADFLEALEVMKRMDKYYTPEQLEQLEQRRQEYGDETIKGFEKQWADLIAAVEAHHGAGTDPSHPQVQELGAQWQSLIEAFTGGDPGIAASLKDMYEQEGPEKASRGMVKPELMEYVGRIMAAKGS